MKNSYNLLILEDETEIVQIYQEYARHYFSKIFTANSMQEATPVLLREQIDCILLDNMLPDTKGIDLVKKMATEKKNIAIIFITAYADEKLAIEALNHGVRYFITKPFEKSDVIGAFKICLEYLETEKEKKYFSDTYQLGRSASMFLKKQRRITDRELEIIAHALEHDDNKSIAEELGISDGTVRRHFENIFNKLNLYSRKELRTFIYQLNTQPMQLHDKSGKSMQL